MPSSKQEPPWRRLVERHPEPILIIGGGACVYVNEAGTRLHGADTPEALLGRSVLAFAAPEHQADLRAYLVTAELGGARQPFAYRLLHLDSEERYVEARAVPLV